MDLFRRKAQEHFKRCERCLLKVGRLIIENIKWAFKGMNHLEMAMKFEQKDNEIRTKGNPHQITQTKKTPHKMKCLLLFSR